MAHGIMHISLSPRLPVACVPFLEGPTDIFSAYPSMGMAVTPFLTLGADPV